MPSQNELTGLASLIVTASVSSATATATAPAPGSVRAAVAVFGLLITSSAAPSGAVAATLTDGTTTLTINLPATIFPAGFSFMFPNGHPWLGVNGQAVTLAVPSLGVLCNATLFYNYVAAK